MSICSLRGFNIRLCRQAFILAQGSRIAMLLPPVGGPARYAHNSLYQMVKKRTLEARTKLQPNKYPNNQACLSQNNPVNQNSTCASPPSPPSAKDSPKNTCTTPASPSAPPCRTLPNPCPTGSSQKQAEDAGKSPSAAKVCQNTKVLSAMNCNVSSKKSGGGQKKSGPAGCDIPNVGPPKMSVYDIECGSRKSNFNSTCVPKKSVVVGGDGATTSKVCAMQDGGSPPKSGVPDSSAASAAKKDISEHFAATGAKKNVCNISGAGSGKKGVCENITENYSKKSATESTAGGGKGGVHKGGDAKGGASKGIDIKSSDYVSYCDRGADGKGKGGAEDGMSKNTKMLLALLAALGAGGLLLWLLMRKKKDGSDAAAGAAEGAPVTIPASSAELPKHVPYLLIGGGTASFSAFRAIKSNEARAKVLMITNEFRKPYMRPPLSKELWYSAQQVEPSKDYRFKQWTGAERSLFFEPEEFFIHPAKLMESANGGIAVAQGFTVRKVDPTKRIVTLSDGYEIGYDECLIATGCTPKNLEVFSNAPQSVKDRIMIYRTPDDFQRLKRFADEKKSITIVGNGFTGSELACSLANYCKDKKVKVYQVFPERGIMSKVLPDYLSKWTTRKVEELGVCVLPNAGVKEAKRNDTMLQVTLNNGSTVMTDIVVVCVGCEANTNIAQVSGLEVDRSLGGFVVNAELEARTNLFVAGDASCFYDPVLGRRRVEHHDHSVVSGRLAGENMVGKKKAYAHQSMFWSDLGPEIGYEGIGVVDASLPTVGVFALPSKLNRNTDNLTETRPEGVESLPVKTGPAVECDPEESEDYGRGVVFYLKNDKIVGILLWNMFNRIGLARTIINQNKKYDDLNEVAKLFEIHS